jgi:hypothetical protein
MGTYAEANICSLLRRDVGAAGVEGETKLVSDINSRPVDTYRNTTVDGGENQSKTDYYVANESRFRGNSTGRDCEVDRRSKYCRSCGGSRFPLEPRADRWLRPHDQCVPGCRCEDFVLLSQPLSLHSVDALQQEDYSFERCHPRRRRNANLQFSPRLAQRFSPSV